MPDTTRDILIARGLNPDLMPAHVAIIMDGNGRWAKKRGLPRLAGHRAGVKTVDRIVRHSVEFGIKVLTLYTFSTENWRRPEQEVKGLMELLRRNLVSQRARLLKNGVRLRISGDISGFPEKVRVELEKTVQETAGQTKLILNLALGYSGRLEILRACRALAEDAVAGKIKPEDIDESMFGSRLFTGDLPDPDLIIRTSGEYRLSNFLLWQSSYSELYFTSVFWPDFSEEEYIKALKSFQQRERRFGDIKGRSGSV